MDPTQRNVIHTGDNWGVDLGGGCSSISLAVSVRFVLNLAVSFRFVSYDCLIVPFRFVSFPLVTNNVSNRFHPFPTVSNRFHPFPSCGPEGDCGRLWPAVAGCWLAADWLLAGCGWLWLTLAGYC